MSATFPKVSRKGILDRDGGAGGVNWTLRLYRNPALVISQDLALSDILECNYSGYAPSNTSDWGAASIASNGIAYRLKPLTTFVHSGGLVGQNVTGFYVTWDDGSGAQLVLVQAFNPSRPMFSALDRIDVVILIGERQGV